jgi:radical SAM superfamily enzyme YgiQ (UPF0313 family)
MNKILAVAINSKFVHTNPALRYIKKYIEQNSDIEITLKEYTINNQLNDIIKNIFRESPTTILFSMYIWNREYVLKLVQEIKKVIDVKIVLGGPEVFYDAKNIMLANPQIDFVCHGEGEQTLLDFLSADDTVPPGIYYRDNGIAFSGYNENIVELDNIPFPYEIAELHEKSKIYYYESSRGCPFCCSYCMSAIDKNVRFSSIDKVKKDLKIFLDNNVKLVKFIDRTYNLKKERYMAIWKFLIDNTNGITCFHFEISADLFDDETIEFLDTVPKGLFQFEIGVQSSNRTTLDAVNRKTDLEKLYSNVTRINKGIHLHLDLIAGLPYEDYATFENSFNFVYSMKPEMIQLGFLKLLKGSPIIQEIEKHDYKYLGFPPYEIMSNSYLSFAEILQLKDVEECLDYYYNSQMFMNSIEFLIKTYYDDNAFNLFEAISIYFNSRGFLDISHKAINLFRYLDDFVISKFGDDKLFLANLKLDYLFREKPGSFPDWFKHEFDNDHYNKLLRSKVLAGEFENLKKAYKQTEIVTFSYDINTWEEANKTYLFIYDNGETKIEELKEF